MNIIIAHNKKKKERMDIVSLLSFTNINILPFADEILNKNGITVDNLANVLKRNDIKKSEAYQSGFLEGTTPMYESYMQLKKSIANSI